MNVVNLVTSGVGMSPNQKTILLVEDDAIIALAETRILENRVSRSGFRR